MSRVKVKGQSIEGPFVAVLKDTLASPAWRAMSHGARSLYICLKSRYHGKQHNNGRLHVSQREAMKEIGSGSEQIARWFRELQHFGFIRMTAPGHLGLDGKGKAPHWRLTEIGYMRESPTREFRQWNGKKFTNQKQRRRKTESRNGKPVRTVTESRYTCVTENRYTDGNKRNGKPVHTE